jgi:serine/threonine protein kinase
MSQCLNPDCLLPNPSGTNFCQKCGNKLLLGDRYRAGKILGQGGFGRTFEAVDEYKPSKPPCVIKQFYPQAQGTSSIQKATELFEREAVRLEQLGKHPQIPDLLAYFSQDGQQYLVQQFIDGENLAKVLESQGYFSEAQIRNLLKNLLPVLEFIHSNQVIHRDIKPENIIQRQNGQLVLVDFGAAKYAIQAAFAVTGTVIGTAGYAAPEQVNGKAIYPSDIYSLGVTCLYLLTEVEPFDLFDPSEFEWAWRKHLKKSVSSELGEILDKMIQPAINKRYQSATEVLQALGSQSPQPSPQPSPQSSPQPRPDPSEKELLKIINRLQTIPGMTLADPKDFPYSTPYILLENNIKINVWKNLAGVDHVFVTDPLGICRFAGYVGWIHSKKFYQILQKIRDDTPSC